MTKVMENVQQKSLDYGPLRRRPKYARLMICMALLGMMGFVAWWSYPAARAHFRMLEAQDVCLQATWPKDQVVWEEDWIEATQLISTGGYRSKYRGAVTPVVRDDSSWRQFAKMFDCDPLRPFIYGQLRRPDGTLRLVGICNVGRPSSDGDWPAVRGFGAIVIAPGSLLTRPRMVNVQNIAGELQTPNQAGLRLSVLSCGIDDPSRIAIGYQIAERIGTMQFVLGNDDKVALELDGELLREPPAPLLLPPDTTAFSSEEREARAAELREKLKAYRENHRQRNTTLPSHRID